MKRKKQAYMYTHFPSISLGFGIGTVKGTDIFDVSISLIFFTFGFRTWRKGEVK